MPGGRGEESQRVDRRDDEEDERQEGGGVEQAGPHRRRGLGRLLARRAAATTATRPTAESASTATAALGSRWRSAHAAPAKTPSGAGQREGAVAERDADREQQPALRDEHGGRCAQVAGVAAGEERQRREPQRGQEGPGEEDARLGGLTALEEAPTPPTRRRRRRAGR